MGILNSKIFFLLIIFFTLNACDKKVAMQSIKMLCIDEHNFIQNNLDKYQIITFKDVNLYQDINNIYSKEGLQFYRLAVIDLTKYIDRNSIKKIIINFYAQDATAHSEYFYKKDKLFFVKKVIKNMDKNDEDISYCLKKEKIVSWEINGKKKKCDSTCKEKEEIILHDSHIYLNFQKLE